MFNIHGFSIKSGSLSLTHSTHKVHILHFTTEFVRRKTRADKRISDGIVPRSYVNTKVNIIQKLCCLSIHHRTLPFRFSEFGDANRLGLASFRHVLYKAPSSNKTLRHVMKQSDQCSMPGPGLCPRPGHHPPGPQSVNNTSGAKLTFLDPHVKMASASNIQTQKC